MVVEIGLQEDQRISGLVSLSELEEIGMNDGKDLKESGDYVDSFLHGIAHFCHSPVLQSHYAFYGYDAQHYNVE
jgi:hypothetical protein